MKQILKKSAKELTILAIFMTLTNCVNENLGLAKQDTIIATTKKWYDLNKPNLTVLDYTQSIDWANAIVSIGDKGTIIEVPLILKGNIAANIGDIKSYQTYNRLMFVADKDETYKVYHVLITTNDVIFDGSNKEFNFYKINNNFDGYITLVNDKKEVIEHKKICRRTYIFNI